MESRVLSRAQSGTTPYRNVYDHPEIEQGARESIPGFWLPSPGAGAQSWAHVAPVASQRAFATVADTGAGNSVDFAGKKSELFLSTNQVLGGFPQYVSLNLF